MLRSRRTLLGALVCCAVTILVAALLWGGGTVSGTATSADVGLSTLDFGYYNGEPIVEPRNNTERYGRIIESVRMAEAIVDPLDIDVSLKPRLPSPIPKPTDVTGILADVARPILTKYGMLAGYSVSGDAGCPSGGCSLADHPWSARVTVLRLPDESAARTAATEIDAADFAVNPGNVAVSLPQYPAAQGHWRPTVPTLGIMLAHGPFIVALFVSYPTPDLGELTGLATKALAAELPVLDRFRPTPVPDLPNLAFDTDGMLRRAVPTTRDEWPYPYLTGLEGNSAAGSGSSMEAGGVVYGPIGSAHMTPSTPGMAPGEIESIAVIDRRWLVRLRSAAAARRFAAEESAPSNRQTVMAAPRVPDTKCLRMEDIVPTYYCVIQDGRYVAVVNATDEKSVHQIAAAQYALLVRNR